MTFRGRLLVGAAFTYSAILSAGVATALESDTSTATMAANSEQGSIVVTGSRIMRDGYNAPTPVMVLGEAEIRAQAPTNIADMVNQLPAVAGSVTQTTNPSGVSGGYSGMNAINLRNLGPTRTLILLDGKRVPYSNLTVGVDVNTLPNALIKRVDVVTAGASAVYGSDAVAGVVNFVLDTDYTGTKGRLQGGVSTYGDNESYVLSLTHGREFAGGRGHMLISAEHAYEDGIRNNPRPWYKGTTLFTNPDYRADNGQPEYLVMDYGAPTASAPGAIITSGPLQGIYFAENGAVKTLRPGPIMPVGTSIGSPDWRYFNIGQGERSQDIAPEVSRQNLFARASFDVSDAVQLYSQFSYGRSRSFKYATPQYYYGKLSIQQDNAFLPDEIAERMEELDLSSVPIGTTNEDLGGVPTYTGRDQYRVMLGVSGEVDGLGTTWAWDVSASKNVSDMSQSALVNNQARYSSAIDAVRNGDGDIVCRSTLTNPDDGCVPFNILGTGTSSQAARDYVSHMSVMTQRLKQDIYAASARAEPLDTWAGPVSVALGVEHRQEELTGEADPLGMANGLWAANFKPTQGANKVTEAFVETVVPLVKDASWTQALDVNAAVRGTDYSNSGFVTTWKLGLSWQPMEDVRFRITRSRDIRAPNLAELFQPGLTLTSAGNDPFTQTVVSYLSISGGNPNLKPEKADTWNVGVVVQPRFLSGLSMSADVFDIKIKDALGSVGNPLQRCYDGEQVFCSLIDRHADGSLKAIRNYQINIAQRHVQGLDLEASYRTMLGEGALTLRAMASHYRKATSNNGLGSISSSIASGIPAWQYRAQAQWQTDRFTVGVTGRGLSKLLYNNSYIVCQTDCPASLPTARTINVAGSPPVFYVDANASYKLWGETEWFFAVSNLVNKAPPPRGTSQTSDAPLGAYSTYHDVIGRSFRTGIRFEF